MNFFIYAEKDVQQFGHYDDDLNNVPDDADVLLWGQINRNVLRLRRPPPLSWEFKIIDHNGKKILLSSIFNHQFEIYIHNNMHIEFYAAN